MSGGRMGKKPIPCGHTELLPRCIECARDSIDDNIKLKAEVKRLQAEVKLFEDSPGEAGLRTLEAYVILKVEVEHLRSLNESMLVGGPREIVDKLKTENTRLHALLCEINKTTYSHVDGRDLLGELHPRHTIDIQCRVDGVETWFEGDWLSNLYEAMKKVRVAIDASLSQESREAMLTSEQYADYYYDSAMGGNKDYFMAILQRIQREALEAAVTAVRKNCFVCDDYGVASRDPDGTPCECEYCGRPMEAIRALIPKDYP